MTEHQGREAHQDADEGLHGLDGSAEATRWCRYRFTDAEGWVIGMPVFVANGDSDPMILPHYSYLLAGLIPDARVKVYPDSAHGFLLPYHAEFAADVEAFLAGNGT